MRKPNVSQVISGKPNKRKSMALAFGSIAASIASASSESKAPEGKFGRVVKIECEKVTIDGSALDVEFEVPFDDDTESNEASITIYNLSDTTISNLTKNNVITITAGYGDDTGVIFTGRISKVTTKWSGCDRVTEIKAIDSYNLQERDVKSISYGKGTKASYILKDLVSRLGLPIAVFKVKKDHTYKDGATVDGGLMAAIKEYAAVCGVSAYINGGKIYVRHLSEGDNINFEINVDTGLIDSPEEFEEEVTSDDQKELVHGVTMKVLLEHRITTAAIVTLKSRNYNGQYRVREGKHVCNESDFYTELTCIG